jgi:uncharacterized damage-inducible protein DinB
MIGGTKMKKALVLGAAVMLFACISPRFSYAQQAALPAGGSSASSSASPVSDAVRQLEQTSAKNIVAGADEMPADKYDFRPTPQQQTFGHLVVHMIGANYGLCSAISGVARPKMDQPKDTDSKDMLLPELKASFEFCTDSLAKVDDSKLGEQVPFFGGRMFARGAMMIIFAQDYGDHYAQEASYLRAAGLTPPTAQRKAGQ